MGFKFALLCAALLATAYSSAIPFSLLDNSIYLEHGDRSARISGGTEAPEGSHPHLVALTTGVSVRAFVCAGSILSERTILTTAYCVDSVYIGNGYFESSFVARIGTNRWNEGGGLRGYDFTHNISHPDFSHLGSKNDISLLFTAREIILGPTVQPIALSFEYVGGDVDVRMAGWGHTSNFHPMSDVLMEINLKTIDVEDCAQRVEEWRPIDYPSLQPEIELCTYHSIGSGVCEGDSGGALTQLSDGKLVGVVSWGFPCAIGAPDMYVRISAYKDFITTNII